MNAETQLRDLTQVEVNAEKIKKNQNQKTDQCQIGKKSKNYGKKTYNATHSSTIDH